VLAVLDPNVIISALLSSKGAPAALLTAGRKGAFKRWHRLPIHSPCSFVALLRV
jgi:hypothetical protein